MKPFTGGKTTGQMTPLTQDCLCKEGFLYVLCVTLHFEVRDFKCLEQGQRTESKGTWRGGTPSSISRASLLRCVPLLPGTLTGHHRAPSKYPECRLPSPCVAHAAQPSTGGAERCPSALPDLTPDDHRDVHTPLALGFVTSCFSLETLSLTFTKDGLATVSVTKNSQM